MTLLERIKLLREKNDNISINKLEKEAGLTRGSMAKWDAHEPSYDKLKKVADYFGVSVGYLLGEETNEKTPTENDERLNEFYELFSKLPDELQARELAYLKELLSELNK